MPDTILDVLTGETVVHANPLATVTRNCLVVRDDVRRSHSVIGITRIRDVRQVNTTNPALLAISGGLLTIAAAAYTSHQGYEVSVPIGLLGISFILGYIGTRRAAVLFLLEDQSIESKRGSYREATSIIRAVKQVREVDA